MSGKDGGKRRKLNVRTAEERAAIVAESFAPGATVAGVARKHGVQPSLLSSWRTASSRRRKARSGNKAGGANAPTGFVPVEVASDKEAAICPEMIEITSGPLAIRLPVTLPVPRIVEIAVGLARS